jgi:ABC-type oligopeptide transport system substrate-binding subunit
MRLAPSHSVTRETRWPGCTGPLEGVCALKMVKLAGVLVLAACVLMGCHEDPAGVTTVPVGTSATNKDTGTATLSWQAPTTNTDGAALTDLSGYRIYYGMNPDDLTQTVQLTGLGLQTYVIDDLGTGTWYFAIKAVTTTGVESALSEVVSKTI